MITSDNDNDNTETAEKKEIQPEVDYKKEKSELTSMMLQTKRILQSLLDRVESDPSLVSANLLNQICASFKLLSTQITEAEASQERDKISERQTIGESRDLPFPATERGRKPQRGNDGLFDLNTPER